MFSLRFDLLFPTILAAKKAAKDLNADSLPADPRAVFRQREELRLAREKLREDVLRRRYHIF